MEKGAVFTLQDVSVAINEKPILDKINFNINSNEIFGIIGPSGAGKTTLLKALIGYYGISAGKLTCMGMDVLNNPMKTRQAVGFASQDNCFYEKLTVYENLEYFGEIHQIDKEKIHRNAENFLKLTELWEKRDVLGSALSGGMKRRLDLCCAMINEPSVLIMDEPTSGLDPLLRRRMWKFIKKIKDLGITIIISSHLLDDIEHLCDRVGVFTGGKLLTVGTPEELKDFYTDNEEVHIQTFPGNYKTLINDLQQVGIPITKYDLLEHKLVMYTKYAEKVVHVIVQYLEDSNEKLIYLEVTKPTLNEVFEVFTQMKND